MSRQLLAAPALVLALGGCFGGAPERQEPTEPLTFVCPPELPQVDPACVPVREQEPADLIDQGVAYERERAQHGICYGAFTAVVQAIEDCKESIKKGEFE